MHRLLSVFATLTICCILVYSDANAENWPQFRGPNGSGTTSEKNLPDTWSKTKNVVWNREVEGRAWSCPVVWGDKIFLTTAISSKEMEFPKKGLYFGGNRKRAADITVAWKAICLEKSTGEVIWERVCAEKTPEAAIHVKNSYASETPVTDGKHLFAYFGGVGLYCFDFAGELVWKQSMPAFESRYGWGHSSSPVIDGERVFIQYDNEKSSFLAAYDKATGKELWKKPRNEGSSWSSPYLWKSSSRTELVTLTTKFARSFDPTNGEELWRLGKHSSITCPTPISTKDRLYISSGYVMDRTRPIYAVKPNAKGDISLQGDSTDSEFIAWSQKQAGPYNPSPLLYKDKIYVLYDRSMFACFDAKTGKAVYKRQRIDGARSGFTCSPWAYDDKIFCLNEDGICFVIAAGDEYKQLHENKLEEMCMSTPAISDGTLFIRTLTKLYAIKNAQK